MSHALVDEKLLRRYLLGELPKDEKAKVEDVYFDDPEVFERLQALEDELIQDYVRNDLPASERVRFERQFLGSKERRKRIEAAKELLQVIDEELERQIGTRAKHVWWQALSEYLRFPHPALRYGLAAAVVVLLVGHTTWLMLQSGKLREQLGQFESEREALAQKEQALSQRLGEQQSRNTELSQQLEQERNQRVQLENTLRDRPQPRSASPSFILVHPEGERGAGTGTQEALSIPPQADSIKLHLRFMTRAEHDTMLVRLESDSNGKELWRQYVLRHTHYFQNNESWKEVAVTLPAKLLSRGQTYLIYLDGRKEAEGFENIKIFRFTR